MRNTKLITALFTLIMIAFSCHKDNDDEVLLIACDVSNPIEDLEWLKNRIDDLEQTGNGEFYISQATHNGKTIFILANCCMACNSVIPVYYCDGKYAGYIGDDNLAWTLLDEDTVIWKPNNSKCF
jgi:hypothetical protein